MAARMRGTFLRFGERISGRNTDEMTWKPNTRDLETIAVLGHPRATVAQIAAALGISEAKFSVWAASACERCSALT